MTKSAAPGPQPADQKLPKTSNGCGFQLFGLALLASLYGLLQYLGWWPQSRGSGILALVVLVVLGGALAVALAGLWDKVRRW